MNRKPYYLALILAIAGCTTTQQAPEYAITEKGMEIPAPEDGDGGVVIAQTAQIETHAAQAAHRYLADCGESHLGVAVESATGEESFLYDGNGEPCQQATTLFDGENPSNTRLPPPSMHIAFHDQLGPRPDTATTMPRIELGAGLDPVTPEEFALGAAGALPTSVEHTEQQDGLNLENTIDQWKELRQREKIFADIREVERMSTGELMRTQQDKILELQAKLQEAKSSKEMVQKDGARLQADIERLRQQLEARGINWEQQEGKMSGEMAELKRRLVAYERKNQELAKTQEEKEAAHRARIARLEADLKAAEAEAEEARQEMVLKAAEKIAEAERLAFAARMAEKEAMQREAARKRQESDMLLERALRMKQGKTVMVPTLSDQLGDMTEIKPLPMPLEKMPVNLHMEGQTLQAVMDTLMSEIKPLAGNWRVSWQLAAQNKFLLEETWTLTAEADFGEILAFITQRIQETHNVTLQFEQYDKIRLLVVSDGSDAPSIQPATPQILR